MFLVKSTHKRQFDMLGRQMLGCPIAMTQVLQHDYGKGKVTLLQIRAAIKAVKAERSAPTKGGSKSKKSAPKGHRPAKRA